MNNPHQLSGKCPFSWPLFLLGLFSTTEVRVIGSIGITELFCFAFGPFFLLREWTQLRQHRFTGFLWLIILMFLGGWVSNMYNDVEIARALRGVAMPYSFLMTIPVFHHFLKKDMRQTRWFFWGLFLSNIISVFIFQRGAAAADAATLEEGTERMMGYSLFWLMQFSNAISLPINAYFLEVPHIFSIIGAVFLLVFSFVFSNNRSGLLIWGGALFLILLGNKKGRATSFLKRYFWLLVFGSVVLGPLVNATYKTLAANGFLGEVSQKKYEMQILVQGKNVGVLDALKAGRAEFFVGLEACLKQPFVGYGSWGVDKTTLVLDYYVKNNARRETIRLMREKMRTGYFTIPCHSWVIQAWVWFGIFGLLWALSIGKMMYRTLRYNMAVYPHLYGYFAFALPGYLWAWLFSPIGLRTEMAFFFTLCLFSDWRQRENKRMGYV